MASKRVKNRCYWVAVKATARKADYVGGIYEVYVSALTGTPDADILPVLNKLEYQYGPHFPHCDLANRGLWDARIIVDDIRKEIKR